VSIYKSHATPDHGLRRRFWRFPAASCRESSTVRNPVFIMIRSLTPPQAAGNALAFAVQGAQVLRSEAYW